jgi:hypothetical protein
MKFSVPLSLIVKRGAEVFEPHFLFRKTDDDTD